MKQQAFIHNEFMISTILFGKEWQNTYNSSLVLFDTTYTTF